eukprot:2383798-Rhodomonas_salina.1
MNPEHTYAVFKLPRRTALRLLPPQSESLALARCAGGPFTTTGSASSLKSKSTDRLACTVL